MDTKKVSQNMIRLRSMEGGLLNLYDTWVLFYKDLSESTSQVKRSQAKGLLHAIEELESFLRSYGVL